MVHEACSLTCVAFRAVSKQPTATHRHKTTWVVVFIAHSVFARWVTRTRTHKQLSTLAILYAPNAFGLHTQRGPQLGLSPVTHRSVRAFPLPFHISILYRSALGLSFCEHRTVSVSSGLCVCVFVCECLHTRVYLYIYVACNYTHLSLTTHSPHTSHYIFKLSYKPSTICPHAARPNLGRPFYMFRVLTSIYR